MVSINRTIDIDVYLSATELGRMFADVDANEQAAILMAVAHEADEWAAPADYQWCEVGTLLAKPEYAPALHLLRQLVAFADLELEGSK